MFLPLFRELCVFLLHPSSPTNIPHFHALDRYISKGTVNSNTTPQTSVSYQLAFRVFFFCCIIKGENFQHAQMCVQYILRSSR